MRTPVGVCIQELASIIQKAESDAPIATMIVENRCTPRETRFQPNIMIPRNAASSMKAIAPSNPRTFPKNPPLVCENFAQFVPN